MKAKIVRQLEKIAEYLPTQMYAYKDRVKIKGKDITNSGLEAPEDMEIDPEKEYIFNSTAYHDVNHLNRLKKAYKRNGKAGIYNYLHPFIKPEMRFQILQKVHALDL